jgi:asparagine synthase (glutamine-hydrolysing)
MAAMTAPMPLPERLRPRPLEVATGLVFGTDPEVPALQPAEHADPRAAMDDVMRDALAHAPCLVSFSGGRDSSAALATATAVARRDGLPLPVPVTLRFADAPGSEESEFQEHVVRHLGLPDWERIALTTEIDSIGEVAQRAMRTHGLLWPFNAHFHGPMLGRARGGTLLTGVGGDELLGPQRWCAVQDLLAGRRLFARTLGRTAVLAFSPRAVRQRRIANRREIRWPWLRPGVEEEANTIRAAWQAELPVSWAGGVDWWWSCRSRVVLAAGLGALAEDAEARIVHPFSEPSVLAAAKARWGRRGPGGRGVAMRGLFSDVLPDAVLGRPTKAWFDEAFFAAPSRHLVRSWTGDGVDADLVDPERLAATWAADRPDPRSFLLLQSVWLSRHNGGRPVTDP